MKRLLLLCLLACTLLPACKEDKEYCFECTHVLDPADQRRICDDDEETATVEMQIFTGEQAAQGKGYVCVPVD